MRDQCTDWVIEARDHLGPASTVSLDLKLETPAYMTNCVYSIRSRHGNTSTICTPTKHNSTTTTTTTTTAPACLSSAKHSVLRTDRCRRTCLCSCCPLPHSFPADFPPVLGDPSIQWLIHGPVFRYPKQLLCSAAFGFAANKAKLGSVMSAMISRQLMSQKQRSRPPACEGPATHP